MVRTLLCFALTIATLISSPAFAGNPRLPKSVEQQARQTNYSRLVTDRSHVYSARRSSNGAAVLVTRDHGDKLGWSAWVIQGPSIHAVSVRVAKGESRGEAFRRFRKELGHEHLFGGLDWYVENRRPSR